MNFARRGALALAIVATVGGGLWLLVDDSTAAASPHAGSAPRWESAQQCKACHEDLYAEWQASHHGIAFTNPEVRQLSDDFRKEECMDCHLPRPLAVTGFGKRTLPRRTHFDEGVSCISCHLGPDGGIVGRADRPEVPCKPKRNDAFLTVDACASCHNQHGTTDQWRASSYAKIGTDCASCHMPAVQRQRPDKSARLGRDHVFPGCHDETMLRSAARFDVAREGDDLVLSMTNVAAGHNFPTEERHRAVDMTYRFVTAAGPGAWQRAWRFRQPYRDEMEPINPGNAPGENTQLPAGATKTVRVTIPEDVLRVETRMWYRLQPFAVDGDRYSTLLYEKALEVR